MTKRQVLISGLVLGAAGIAVLWAGGVDFPVAVPPGLVALLVGAGIVAAARRPWADLVGLALAAFILVGFVVSGVTGEAFGFLLGRAGLVVCAGQVVELAGVLVAVAAGAVLVSRGSGSPR